jgi:hypothetical protein
VSTYGQHDPLWPGMTHGDVHWLGESESKSLNTIIQLATVAADLMGDRAAEIGFDSDTKLLMERLEDCAGVALEVPRPEKAIEGVLK